MGKGKNKNKQRGKQLPTAPIAKAVSAAPTVPAVPAPPSAVAPPPKVATPPVAMAKGVNAPPPAAPAKVVPPVAAPPKAIAPPAAAPATKSVPPSIGREEGTVISRVYDAKGNVRFGRIRKADGKLITCHSKGSTVPIEGTIVHFSTYTHDSQTVAKVEATVGTDALIAARLAEIVKTDVYQLIPAEQWYGAGGTETFNGAIMGSTVEGMLLLHVKDSRE